MRNRLECPEPMRGDRVEVVKGRKSLGLKGVLGWHGESRYGYRAGVDPEGGGERVWIDYKNLLNHSWEERYAVYSAEVEKREAEKKAAREAEEAMVLMYLKMGEVKSLGCAGMSGWRDEYRLEVPLVDPEAPEEMIAKAVYAAYPSQSSWGALRWRAGVRVEEIDRKAGVVRVIESVGLAD